MGLIAAERFAEISEAEVLGSRLLGYADAGENAKEAVERIGIRVTVFGQEGNAAHVVSKCVGNAETRGRAEHAAAGVGHCHFDEARVGDDIADAARLLGHKTPQIQCTDCGRECSSIYERFFWRSRSISSYTLRMDNERIREICLGMPNVVEKLNWGHRLVYFVGDRDIGGKMFAMTDLDGTGFGVLWFHCGAERFHELLEVEGISASPYLARAHWVTVERWDVLRARQIEDELKKAHALIYEKLPKRTKTVLAMPEKERAKVIRERKKVVKQRSGVRGQGSVSSKTG